MSTLIFDEITKDYLKVGRDWSLPAWAPIEREYLIVPGRAGGIPKRMQTGLRRFAVPIVIDSKTLIEKEAFIEDMAAWLVHEDPKPLRFSKYHGRTFFAQIEGAPDFPEMWMRGKGTLSFVCPDPYKYGDEETVDFVNGVAFINNQGTAEAKPIYEFDVLEDLTHLDIVSDKGYMRIGEQAPIDIPVYARQTLVLSDSMKTLTGWSDAIKVDNGHVAGTMKATASGFEAEAFGTEMSPRAWQGPAKRRSLPSPVQNFQLIATVELLNVGKQTGMIEIYCLDAFGNTVVKVGVEDVLQSIAEVQTKFQLGNVENRKVQKYRTADYKPAWNNYKGVLRLFRDGNRFRPYFGLVQPNGKHVWVSNNYLYTDVKNEYAAPITHIQVAIRKWPATTEAIMRVRDLKVWRLNDPVEEGVPTIATAGDHIVIDTNDSSIRINGEERKDLKDFGATFFKLARGLNTLLLQPSAKVTGKVRYREPYL